MPVMSATQPTARVSAAAVELSPSPGAGVSGEARQSAARPRVAHVITGLNTGGAETMLYKLLAASQAGGAGGAGRFEAEVISLTDCGAVAEKIEALGVPVRALGMMRGLPNPAGLARLARWLRRRRPSLIQTWLYHADLIGGVIGKSLVGVPVVWNVRSGDLTKVLDNRMTLLTLRACAALSRRVPDAIVSCSESATAAHVEIGYDAGKITTIPNGFDLAAFHPDAGARASVRRELGLGPDAPLVGLVARFDDLKDHRTFIRAAARLRAAVPAAHFLLCGPGVEWANEQLAEWIRVAGVAESFHLLGRRDDVPRLNAALDVAALTSRSEGFPNVLGEAMACGVPCVSTDAGEARLIVGDTGLIVPVGDDEGLAAGWRKMLTLDAAARREVGEAARRRILERYSLPAVAAKYEALYEGLLTHPEPANY
jgi:glycosyltransferase involved in cell wall biosynthesis